LCIIDFKPGLIKIVIFLIKIKKIDFFDLNQIFFDLNRFF